MPLARLTCAWRRCSLARSSRSRHQRSGRVALNPANGQQVASIPFPGLRPSRRRRSSMAFCFSRAPVRFRVRRSGPAAAATLRGVRATCSVGVEALDAMGDGAEETRDARSEQGRDDNDDQRDHAEENGVLGHGLTVIETHTPHQRRVCRLELEEDGLHASYFRRLGIRRRLHQRLACLPASERG